MCDDIYLVFLPSSPDGNNTVDGGALVQKWIRAGDTLHLEGQCEMPTELPTSIPDLEKIYRRDYDIDEWPTLIRWSIGYYEKNRE